MGEEGWKNVRWWDVEGEFYWWVYIESLAITIDLINIYISDHLTQDVINAYFSFTNKHIYDCLQYCNHPLIFIFQQLSPSPFIINLAQKPAHPSPLVSTKFPPSVVLRLVLLNDSDAKGQDTLAETWQLMIFGDGWLRIQPISNY